MILDGKVIAEQRIKELKEEVAAITKIIKRKPILSIIQLGDLPASSLYIKNKKRVGEQIGVEVRHHQYPTKMSQNSLLKKMDIINDEADGVIIQLPLPKHISPRVILNGVRLQKDIDGLCEKSKFNFYNEKEEELYYIPATAQAIMDIVNYYKIDVNDKKVAVIGRSYLVGKPTAFLLKKAGGSVSTYNKNTGIKGVETADILVSSAGQPNLVTKDDIKRGAFLIDAGISWIEKDGKKVMVGDANLEGDYEIVAGYTPVPGGVGPLTVVWLFKNLIKAVKHEFDLT